MSDCPMCDAELQSGWVSCPTCGHNLEEVQAEKKTQSQGMWLGLAILIVIVLVFVFYMLDFQALGF